MRHDRNTAISDMERELVIAVNGQFLHVRKCRTSSLSGASNTKTIGWEWAVVDQQASAEPSGTECLLDPRPQSGCAACIATARICREVRVTHLATSGVISRSVRFG